MQKKLQRISTDVAGYGLILLGIASGWLPGPGGIPLVLAGLGLLSIHNKWARRLRDWLIKNSTKTVNALFPEHRLVQFLYDVAVILLLAVVGALFWEHSAIWQISLAIFALVLALLIAGFNRGRLRRVKYFIKKP